MAQSSSQAAQIPVLEHAVSTADKKQKEKKNPKVTDGSSGYPLEVRVSGAVAISFTSFTRIFSCNLLQSFLTIV